jgi:hypothetical protein
MDPSLYCRAVPLHSPIHDTVIGDGYMLDAEVLRPAGILLRATHAIEERILSVKVQMRELCQTRLR